MVITIITAADELTQLLPQQSRAGLSDVTALYKAQAILVKETVEVKHVFLSQHLLCIIKHTQKSQNIDVKSNNKILNKVRKKWMLKYNTKKTGRKRVDVFLSNASFEISAKEKNMKTHLLSILREKGECKWSSGDNIKTLKITNEQIKHLWSKKMIIKRKLEIEDNFSWIRYNKKRERLIFSANIIERVNKNIVKGSQKKREEVK